MSPDTFMTITLIIVFSMVLITMLKYFSMKKQGKEIKRWFKVLMFFVLLIGVRHLNPLRWPDTAIRVIMLTVITPVGMTWDEVGRRVDNIPGWRMVGPDRPFTPGNGVRATLLNHNSPYFVPQREGGREVFVGAAARRGYIGRYRQMFIFLIHVYPIWVFDENGILIDVSIGGQLQL